MPPLTRRVLQEPAFLLYTPSFRHVVMAKPKQALIRQTHACCAIACTEATFVHAGKNCHVLVPVTDNFRHKIGKKLNLGNIFLIFLPCSSEKARLIDLARYLLQ